MLTMGRLIHICVMRLYGWAIGLAAATGNAKARGWLAMRQGNLDRVEKATQRSWVAKNGCGFTVLRSGNLSKRNP